MPLNLPQYTDVLATVLADFASGIVQYNSLGQRIPPDLSEGSPLLALARRAAAIEDALYGLAEKMDAATRLSSATGQDLADIGYPEGITPIAGLAAFWPVKYGRAVGTTGPVPLPALAAVRAPNPVAGGTLLAHLQQDPAQPSGVAGVLPAGANSVWIFAPSDTVGAAGNIAAGQINGGDPIAGLILLGNPQTADPVAPTLSVLGTAGTTTLSYRMVVHGITGTTLPGLIATITNAPTTFGVGSGVHVTWATPDDSTAVDILKLVGGVWMALALSTQAGFVDDTGQTTSTYTLPTLNTTQRATGGVDDESDTSLRARIPTAPAARGSATLASIMTKVAAVPGVARVFGQDLTPINGYVTIRVVPQVPPFTLQQRASVQNVIDTNRAGGVTGILIEQPLTPVDVAYTVQTPAGTFTPSYLVPGINAAITAYLAGLPLAGQVLYTGMVAAISGAVAPLVVTISALTMTVSGTVYGRGAAAGLDSPSVPGQALVVGNITASIS